MFDVVIKLQNDDSEEIDNSKMAKPRRPVDSDDEEYKPQIVVLENSNVTPADVETCKASATEEDEEGTCYFKTHLFGKRQY